MAAKENKGGLLKNNQIEQDRNVRGGEEGYYEGSQDTGDKNPVRTTHISPDDTNNAQNEQQDEEE